MVIKNTGRLLDTKKFFMCVDIFKNGMTSQLNDSMILNTGLASLLIVLGVVTKNTSKQYWRRNSKWADYLGALLFAGGWAYMAIMLSHDRPDYLVWVFSICAALIFGSVFLMMMTKTKGTMRMVYPLVFAASWLVLGYYVGDHLDGDKKYLGLVSSALVITSMLWVLPYQRKKSVVDGPGMPMFVAAWGIIIYLNSLDRTL